MNPHANGSPDSETASAVASASPFSGKVAHVMRRFVPHKWGGTESVVFNLARTSIRHGMASPVFCTDMFSTPGTDRFETVPIRRFRFVFPWLFLGEEAQSKLRLKGGSPLSFSLFFALLMEPALTVIHAHAQHRLGGIARTVARLRGIPYVVSIHGGYLTLPEEQSRLMQDPFRGKPEWGKLFGWLLGARRVLEDADAILCVGRDEHEQMRQRYGNKAHYVPNGVCTDLFRNADPAAFRSYAGLRPGERLALCVSRIDYQKNQLLLLRAFARFATSHPEWKLALIGAVTVEAYRDQLHAEIQKAGLVDRVLLIPGFQPDDPRLPSAYKAADLFILPTVHEPFGIVILEAWASGVPVIASRVGGIPGFTHDGEDILLFEKNDEDALLAHWVRLAEDAPLRDRLKAQALREVARYDWEAVAGQVCAIYAAARAHQQTGRTDP
jgi:glycosyltransferase involved in cell wall biosynthesis